MLIPSRKYVTILTVQIHETVFDLKKNATIFENERNVVTGGIN